MSNWAENATWDDLITILLHAEHDDPERFHEAVEEVYRRIPRVSDFNRIIGERFQAGAPLGTLPDWKPAWIDDAAQDTWLVRLLSNDGVYPEEPIVHDAGLLVAEGDLAWSAVYWPGEHPSERAPISWLHIEEVLFFGAISLAEAHPRTEGRPRIYTRSAPDLLHVPDSATFEDIYNGSREIALRLRDGAAERLVAERGERRYRLERDYNEQVEVLLEAMEKYDSAVLLRGLYKFLIATELFQHQPFLEEMALSAIISREAALELLRRKFSASTGKRWKKENVIEKIRTEFPTGEPFTKVLRWDWENRVIMVHPVSDHGEFWSPPVEVEECYDTLTSLVYLYRYLLLDEIWIPGKYD